MPLQNRVDPWGRIIVTPARGTFMGNRGVLHNEQREIVRQYANRRWITCVLEFRGRKRTVMSPHRYTELFFLDEAVALSAGHRPCAECRRDRFKAFREAWTRAAGPATQNAPSADEMDAELHRTRSAEKGGHSTLSPPVSRCKSVSPFFSNRLDGLPDGCFIQIDEGSYLVWRDTLLLWAPQGYQSRRDRRRGLEVTVLTPEPIVGCLRHGYRPEIHSSAFAL